MDDLTNIQRRICLGEDTTIGADRAFRMIQFIAARYCLDALEIIIIDLNDEQLLTVLKDLEAGLLKAFEENA